MEEAPKLHFSVHYFSYWLISLIALVVILDWAQVLLIPITFGGLLAFILLPLCKRLERWGMVRLWASVFTFIILLSLTSGITIFFSAQIISIMLAFEGFGQKLQQLTDRLENLLQSYLPFVQIPDIDKSTQQLYNWLFNSSIVPETIGFAGLTLSMIGMIPIYAILILIYRDSIITALSSFVPDTKLPPFLKMLKSVQNIGKKYIFNLGLVILLIGILNSLGLYFIGIDYPFFFGFLASLMAVIPYVGTTFGAFIPCLYALLNYNSLAYPAAVLTLFVCIQFIDDNFLTPKIVGGGVNLNPIISIIALFLGGFVWGIAGMIIALPMAAIIKEVCSAYVELHPISILMGDEIFTSRPHRPKRQKKKQVPATPTIETSDFIK
ncbi:MAG TPA: hypothetical protein DCM08_08085 [Microscillaceae bacterium]|jgi:predicted PurR-regulated permease PerM|nr:hypothetical protein [Microscillaceae bacterium]